LVLGGGGDVFVHRQVGEKSLDLRRSHFAGMALVVEQDGAADPVQVGVLSTEREVFEADGISDLVEEFLGSWFHGCFSNGVDSLRFLSYSCN